MLKNVLIPALLGLSLVGCKSFAYQPAPEDFVIRRDLGGEVLAYKTKANSLKGKRVVVDGKCYSACMYLISDLSSGKYCATERADLGFHGAFYVSATSKRIRYADNLKERASAQTEEFLNLLPGKVRARLLESGYPSVYNGDSPDKVERITGEEAVSLLGRC